MSDRPLRSPDGVVALARRIAAEPALRFAGIMSYEAQLAGTFASESEGVAYLRRLLASRETRA